MIERSEKSGIMVFKGEFAGLLFSGERTGLKPAAASAMFGNAALREKMMNFRTFHKDIKEKKIKPCCLLYGKEQFLVEWAKNTIIEKYVNDVSRQFDVITIGGTETGVDRIVESSETLPVFSEKKLVIVEDFSVLEGEKNKNIEEKDIERLIRYIEHPSQDTILIFTCGEKPDKRRKLFKTIQKYASVYDFQSLEPGDLNQWVIKRFHSYGKEIEKRELERMISLSGYFDKDSDYTLYHFEQDISKVVLHSEGDRIRMEDVEKTVAGNINTNIFQLIEYVSAGEKQKAFDLLGDLFLYGETEYGLLALLYRQYEILLNIRQLSESGMSSKAIAETLGLRDFVVTKSRRLVQQYTQEQLKGVLTGIYQADKNIKSGNMEGRMAVELLIASI